MASRTRVVLGVLGAATLIAGLLGCDQSSLLGDRLNQGEVARLGPEDPTAPAGPLHRPGQACVVCHRADGAAEREFVAAGTIYRDPGALVAVADAEVFLVDSEGTSFTTRTNCVGNFYVRPAQFRPVPPFWTSVQLGEFPFKMASPIHREGSCASCHFDPAGAASAGHVFVADDETTFAAIPLRPCGPADEVSR